MQILAKQRINAISATSSRRRARFVVSATSTSFRDAAHDVPSTSNWFKKQAAAWEKQMQQTYPSASQFDQSPSVDAERLASAQAGSLPLVDGTTHLSNTMSVMGMDITKSYSFEDALTA